MAAAKGNQYAKKAVTRNTTLGNVRMTQAELAAWTQAAMAANCTFSEYVRRVLNWSVRVMVDQNGLEHALRRMGHHRRRNFRHQVLEQQNSPW
jgi:hypothetical protein